MNSDTTAMTGGRERWSPTERVGLGLLLGFTVVALIGYAVFGRHPALLGSLPAGLRRFYGVSFGFFAQVHVLLAGGLFLFVLWRRSGVRWVGAFALLYGASLLSELSGTRYGVPFGAYEYSELLGVRWFGLVPVLIPLSWFAMAVPSYALASRVAGHGARARVLSGSFLLLAWDLSLDPAMSFVTRYWVWGEAGPYYGMPLVNLLGWYVTGLVLMALLHVTGARTWLRGVPVSFMAAFYAVNLLLPMGMNAAAGLAGAVVAGLLPLLLLCGPALRRRWVSAGSPMRSGSSASGKARPAVRARPGRQPS
jgi:uncharacterized membrane protein